RGPDASASAREPMSGTGRPAQGRLGLVGLAPLFRGAYGLSRRLSRPESTRLGPWHQESTVSADHHQLGPTTRHRAPRIGPHASGLAPESATRYERPHADAGYQCWP